MHRWCNSSCINASFMKLVPCAWCRDAGNCSITCVGFHFVEYEVSFLISSDQYCFEVDFLMYFNGYTSFVPFIFKWLWGKTVFLIILFYKHFKFILHTHHSFSSFLSSHSLPPSPIYYSSSVSIHEGQVSHGLEESMAYQLR